MDCSLDNAVLCICEDEMHVCKCGRRINFAFQIRKMLCETQISMFVFHIFKQVKVFYMNMQACLTYLNGGVRLT